MHTFPNGQRPLTKTHQQCVIPAQAGIQFPRKYWILGQAQNDGMGMTRKDLDFFNRRRSIISGIKIRDSGGGVEQHIGQTDSGYSAQP